MSGSQVSKRISLKHVANLSRAMFFTKQVLLGASTALSVVVVVELPIQIINRCWTRHEDNI